MQSAHPSRIVFTGKQQVQLESFSLPAVGGKEVHVRTEFSLMSTGTENIVFNRAFDPGTHWDGWVKYPFYPGYTSVGVIVAVGSDVSDRRVGQRVAYRVGHASDALVSSDATFPIPDALPSEEAIWFALAKIAFQGARAAQYFLGDSALVIGAGPVGQMSIRWAAAAGCKYVVAVDPLESRLAVAKAGGATTVIGAPIANCRDQVLAACDGALPRIVIDGTGNHAVFASALSLTESFGRVVILGDTGQPTAQTLTHDVITRGLTIVGAHDIHENAQWNDASVSSLFFALSTTNRFNLKNLTSHRFKPQECQDAYRLANTERAKTMGVLFDWSK
ncbi:MAG: zinc-binding alcohol dehydrogenase [Opitutaceae bacterium]|nr:zinc-binding alcohol dehydrogenase [Opitutaceae bacterium]